MNELNDLLEAGGGQVLRSTLVAAGLLLTRQALKGYMPAKWSYWLCLAAAVWLLIPVTPPSVASLWRFLPSHAERSVTFPQSETEKTDASLFPDAVFPVSEETVNPEPFREISDTAVDSKGEMTFELVAGDVPKGPGPLIWIALIWALGVVILSLLLIYREVKVQIAIRQGKQLHDDTLEEARKRLAVKRNVRLIQTGAMASPALAGLLRPVILIGPEFGKGLNENGILHVFLHELVHLKRHDVLSRLLLKLAFILQWPNPVAWWMMRVSLEDVEMATDAEVLANLENPKERECYGQTLLAVARTLQNRGSRLTLNLLGMAESTRSNLELRIRRIAGFGRGGSRRWPLVFVVIATVLLSLAVGFQPTMAEGEKSAAEDRRIGTLMEEIHKIMIPSVEFTGTKLSDALDVLKEASKEADPARVGVPIVLSIDDWDRFRNAPITLQLRNVPLAEALRQTAELAGLTYRVDDNLVTFCRFLQTDLYTNVYIVPPAFLESRVGEDPINPGALSEKSKEKRSAKEVLESAGITFQGGASAIYNPEESKLIVRNTEDQIELVEAYIDSVRAGVESQIQIKVTQFVSATPFTAEGGGEQSNHTAGVSRIFESAESMEKYLFSDEVKEQVAEVKRKVEQLREKGVESFSPIGVFMPEQLEKLMQQLEAKTNVEKMELPSAMGRSGKRIVIAGEDVGIGADPVVGADNFTIDLNVVFRLLGENAELLPKTRQNYTIWDGQTLAYTGKIDRERFALVFLTATIVDATGEPLHKKVHPMAPEENEKKMELSLENLSATSAGDDWQELVRQADELALEGLRAFENGQPKVAEEKFRDALKILPDLPESEPRQKSYLEQWYRALKEIK